MSILRKDYRHSASRGNAFIDSPAYWIISELFDYTEKPNPRMIMGLAAEHAAQQILENVTGAGASVDWEHNSKLLAKQKYEELGGSKDDPECDMAKEISVRFVQNLNEFGKVVSYQNEKIVEDSKLKFPIKCITDFEFNDVIVDTKATAYLKRLKSGRLDNNWYPKSSDIRQQLLYKRIYNKPTMLLYASAKDQEAIDMVDRVSDIDLIQVFQTIEHICSIAKSKDEVVKMFPLTMDNFRWGKDMTPAKEFAMDIWKRVWKS